MCFLFVDLRRTVDGSPQHASDVCVDRGDRPIKGEAGDRAGSGVAEPGEVSARLPRRGHAAGTHNRLGPLPYTNPRGVGDPRGGG